MAGFGGVTHALGSLDVGVDRELGAVDLVRGDFSRFFGAGMPLNTRTGQVEVSGLMAGAKKLPGQPCPNPRDRFLRKVAEQLKCVHTPDDKTTLPVLSGGAIRRSSQSRRLGRIFGFLISQHRIVLANCATISGVRRITQCGRRDIPL